MLVRFEETEIVVEIPAAAEFHRALRAAAFDWPVTEVASGDPVSRVVPADGRYLLESPGREPVVASAVEAVCGLIVDVADAAIAEAPNRLWLHCAAVEFGGRLVIFPSHSHAGKSTLTARLASAGHTVLGDDILPLSDDDRQGIALGIAPRLRLPLPVGASASFGRFVAENTAASDGRYLYLDADCGALAPRGTSREIGAVVLLDRQDETQARFSRATDSETLQTLIRQNFTGDDQAARQLDRLHLLVAGLPCLKLTYSDLEDAVSLLESRFRRWPIATDDLSVYRSAATEAMPGDPADGFSADRPFRQADGIELRQVEGDLFLAEADGAGIYHLNAIGTGIWNLLADPISAREAEAILCEAFPDEPAARISRDTRALFAELDAAGFIQRADQSAI
jgi:hypothetical protein